MAPLFLVVKLFDIGLVTMYYFAFGIIISVLIDKSLGKFNEEDYKTVSSFRLFLEIVGHLFALGVLSYILRNLIERIPFPFEGIGGFQHLQLKEIQGGIVLSFVLLFFQSNLTDKIMYLKKRFIN